MEGPTPEPHVVVVPFPAQGHVNPLMHVCQALAKQSVRVTVVNSEFVHRQLVPAMGDNIEALLGSRIQLLSVPADSLSPSQKTATVEGLFVDIMNNLKCELRKLLSKMIAENGVACVLADLSMAFILEVAEELGIRGALFSVFSAAHSVFNVSIGKLVEDGVVDCEGVPTKEQRIQVKPGMPYMHTKDFPWRSVPYEASHKKLLFKHVERFQRGYELAKYCLINTTYELEPDSFISHPKNLAVGPLTATKVGQFWKEDGSCIQWLDQQTPSSVIYMAFGSSSYYSKTQVQEIAMGIELTGRPFLWVVRPGTENEFPANFEGSKGKIVGWAPQQEVLKHPSVACYMSHCGWGSVLEGVSSGLGFLCLPYIGDHYFNMSYIVDIWKIGIGFEKDENGVVSRWEIKKKVDQLLGDDSFKVRSAVLKEKVKKSREPEGLSSTNIDKFIKWVKEDEKSI